MLSCVHVFLLILYLGLWQEAADAQDQNATSPSHKMFPRRSLNGMMMQNLKANATIRQIFCNTCKPRNCERPILKRRCAFESTKAKKCACCNFCPDKWRKAKPGDKTAWRSETTVEEVIAFMKKKLPKETSTVCRQYGVQCSAAQLCFLNIQNLPVCRCLPLSACGRGTRSTMVCASNGLSYLSRCHLLVSACGLRVPLRTVRSGPCREEDAEPLLAGQIRLNIRRKWRRRHRKGKRVKRRRFADRLLQLIHSNQRERRRLLREMKRLRRLQRSKRRRRSRYSRPHG